MKQFVILALGILSVMYSCSDEKLTQRPVESSAIGARRITFALFKTDGGSLEVTTKAGGTVVTDDYTVVFYLFAKNESSRYVLMQKDTVTTPLYTIEGLAEEGTYKYIFVATTTAHASALEAIDFSSVYMDNQNDLSITLPSKPATPADQSILENCYLPFFDDIDKAVPNYGGEWSRDPETITIHRDLDIFGCGALIQPGMTFDTPVNAVMERQFGVVEFRYSDAQAGDVLTCSFSSEYYRLYLSQLVRTTDRWYYISDNSALFPEGVFESVGLANYTDGDYYSASAVYRSGYGLLPILKKTKTLSTGENSIQVYVPYSTGEAVGAEVDDKYKANYVRTDLLDIDNLPIKGVKKDITLTVERGGMTWMTYTLAETPFPIYQNGKTVFTTVGKDYFQVFFGPLSDTSDNGIQLDPDGWHGE